MFRALLYHWIEDMPIVDWKKNARHRNCELSFIQGPYSPGDSLSDSSAELLQRGKGGARIWNHGYGVKSISPAFINQGRSRLQRLPCSLNNKMFAWVVFQKLGASSVYFTRSWLRLDRAARMSIQWPFDIRGLKTPPSDCAKRLRFERAETCSLVTPE